MPIMVQLDGKEQNFENIQSDIFENLHLQYGPSTNFHVRYVIESESEMLRIDYVRVVRFI